MAVNEEKKKALDAAIAKLEKDFGKGAVMKLGESGAHVAVETVPTGCLSLDLALGLGGVWFGIAPDRKRMDAVHQVLDLPEDVEVFSMFALGYPAESRPQQNRYDESRIHFVE